MERSAVNCNVVESDYGHGTLTLSSPVEAISDSGLACLSRWQSGLLFEEVGRCIPYRVRGFLFPGNLVGWDGLQGRDCQSTSDENG